MLTACLSDGTMTTVQSGDHIIVAGITDEYLRYSVMGFAPSGAPLVKTWSAHTHSWSEVHELPQFGRGAVIVSVERATFNA